MESITRNIRDIQPQEKFVLESLVGHPLHAGQEIVIQVKDWIEPDKEPRASDYGKLDSLPSWCRVFEGLAEEDIVAIERIALERANMTRIPG
jgi:hypothetical protein